MLAALAAIAALLVIVVVWAVATYNGLRRLQYACADAWSLIDVQLQRRTDLVPNLVATVKAYAAHERVVLDGLAAARAAAAPLHAATAQHAAAEDEVGRALARAVALGEAYPELAASAAFVDLQETLSDLEDDLAASREIYNGNVARYRDRLHQVPSAWVARRFNFEDRQPFTIDLASERTPVRPSLRGAP